MIGKTIWIFGKLLERLKITHESGLYSDYVPNKISKAHLFLSIYILSHFQTKEPIQKGLPKVNITFEKPF